MRNSLLIISVTIVFFLSGFSGVVFAQDEKKQSDANYRELLFSATTEGTSMIDVLLVNQEITNEKRGIILKYCDTVLKKNAMAHPDDDNAKDLERFGFDVDKYKYDPRQSLFVYGMCVTIDETSNGRRIGNEQYRYRNYKEVFEEVKYNESPDPVALDVRTFRKDDIDFNELRGLPTQSGLDAGTTFSTCNPATTMQSCMFSSIMPTIFKNIMNEYSNIKLAAIYGYNKSWESDDEILNKAVKDFSHNYFKDPVDENSPCNYKDMPYLNPETTDGKQRHCSHPETNKELKESIKSAQRLIDKLQFLDHEMIMDPFQEVEKSAQLAEYCKDKEKGTKPNHLLHACGFSNRGDVGFHSDRQIFYNLHANELMRYNLFIDYYGNRIITNTGYGSLAYGSVSAQYRSSLREVKILGYEKSIAKQAMFQTLRMLTNVYTTFPSYIALRAYQEDLLNYRESLAKTYTPTHQLYYTFRNVQACQDGQ